MSPSRPRDPVLMSAAPESSREAERMEAAASLARCLSGPRCEPSPPPARRRDTDETQH